MQAAKKGQKYVKGPDESYLRLGGRRRALFCEAGGWWVKKVGRNVVDEGRGCRRPERGIGHSQASNFIAWGRANFWAMLQLHTVGR